MRSILDKALAALLEGKKELADALFHDFVLERARQVNESIVETGEADVDAIVEGKTFKRGKDEDADDKKKEDQRRKEGAKQKRGMAEGEELDEGKTFKRGQDDEEDVKAKKKEDQSRKQAAKDKRGVAESEDLEEGKTFKRGEDEDADDKKKADKQRKDASKQKREQVAESQQRYDRVKFCRMLSQFEPKTQAGDEIKKLAEDPNALPPSYDNLFRLIDEIYYETIENGSSGSSLPDEKVDLATVRKMASAARSVNEGKLEIEQEEDGTLHMTHFTAGSTGDEVTANPIAPVAPTAAPEMPMADPMGGPDLGTDATADSAMDAPLPGVEDLNDDFAFESLKESLADELEKIIVNHKDGSFATGGSTSQEDHSPVPNVAAKDRINKAGATETKQDSHNGFDKEPAPKTSEVKVGKVRNGEHLEAVSKEGDKGALLNQLSSDKTAKSPIAGK